ncbi:DUF3108 domain-containing protein [Jiulongibacter sp. NS-SX5]|uniref:DUF3108 domain-containing protein n=1 Tax=Jiulongibacter sp. NS-SX5 TaxID=3463854 RepID=UPI00405906AB
MKKWILAFLGLILVGFSAFTIDRLRSVENHSFQAGEAYVYKVKYGFITIGQANVDVHPKIFRINNRPCYRVNVLGKTAGMASIWKVSNTYRSYIDTTAIIPHKFVYSARENNFARDQTFTFDHQGLRVSKREKDKVETYDVPKYVQDVISGYYYLRTFDFGSMAPGSAVKAPMFFDDKLYNMTVSYSGKETIKTKFGKMEVLKLNPILPPNKLFEGKDAIRIFVSNDENRVPVQLEIDFSFGTISMELNDYQNVRNPFRWS